MNPPTHADGATSYNSCGWHSGSCLNNQNGPALDWGYWNGGDADYNVRFRGWLYRSSTSYSSAYLKQSRIYLKLSPGESDTRCAIRIATTLYPEYTYVSGSGIGAWNSPIVAYMVNDGGCPWTAYHAYVQPVALSYYSENRATYPCCNYGGTWVQNNLQANKTHTTQFLQGH